MKFEAFELSVLQLAHRGVRLTVPNVAVQLGLHPTKSEEWLDRMAYDGRLDVELDEQEGLVFYRVRGLSPMTTAMVPFPQPPPRAITARQKSTFWGAAFGLVFPGFGLFYAAPWKVVGLASLATLLAVKMTAAIPILGPLLSSVTLGICAIASAVLGVLYTKQFNQFGRRASLDRQQVVSHTARWPQAAASAVNTAFHRAG